MEKNVEIINGKEYEIYSWSMYMTHADWHEAEELNLKLVTVVNNHQDYWDNYMIFCKEEDFEVVENEYRNNEW